MKKTFVLDTNVLLSDNGALSAFDDNDIIIPMIALEELDAHKTRQDEVGACARATNRALDEMRLVGGSLSRGVTNAKGGILRVVSLHEGWEQTVPIELRSATNDNMIIATAVQLVKGGLSSVRLVSKDINVRIKCDAIGVTSEDYKRVRASVDGEFYTGVEVVEGVADELTEKLYLNDRFIDIDEARSAGLKTAYPNQVVVLKNVSGGTVLTRVVERENDKKRLEMLSDPDNAFGLTPRNKEQKFSLGLLCDPAVKLVTLSGPAGTGKSLIAVAAAMHQLIDVGEQPRYERFIIMRPVQPVGKDLGFLPGTLEEKMAPWIAPIEDNLNFLINAKKPTGSGGKTKKRAAGEVSSDPYLSLLQEKGRIEIEAITFIRGRSIPNSIILVDEAQNLSLHELKTILTRASEGTKIILTGDLAQIDNPHLDANTNAMSYAIERFKESPLAGHVTLLKGVRSALATLAAKVL